MQLWFVHVALDISDLPVDAVLTTNLAMEWKPANLRVASQPPRVDLRAGELRTVDARLLAGADPECHGMPRVRDCVRLRVTCDDHGEHQVRDGRGGQRLFRPFPHHSFGDGRRSSLLFEAKAKELASVERWRLV